MRLAPGLVLLALAACDAAAPPAAEEEAAEAAAAAPAAMPAGAAPPAEMTAGDLYATRIAGRWSEAPNCGGMTWNFQPDSFTTPGETHCAQIALSEGPGEAVRVSGSRCVSEGAPEPDVRFDAELGSGGETLTVTGVDALIRTRDWPRCR